MYFLAQRILYPCYGTEAGREIRENQNSGGVMAKKAGSLRVWGGGLCSRVILSSALTLILSFCPARIFSLIFFLSFFSILSFCVHFFSFFSLLLPSCWWAFSPPLLLSPHHLLSSNPKSETFQMNFILRKSLLPPPEG